MASSSDGEAAEPKIKFNNSKEPISWPKARDAYHKLSATAKPGSVWAAVRLVSCKAGDEGGPFQSRCLACDQTCQLGNPAKWRKYHKCKGKAVPAGMGVGARLPGTMLPLPYCLCPAYHSVALTHARAADASFR